MQLLEVFKENVVLYTEQEKKWEKLSFRYSVIRITFFIAALFLLVFFANAREGQGLALVVIAFPVIFGLIVRKHNEITRQKELAGNLRVINEEEVRRCNHNLAGLPEGNQWLTRDHAYAYDLDIFGQNSLFQLLNRTSTPSGESRLASWLLGPSSSEEIGARQSAVEELSEDLNWNQRFQAAGRIVSNATNQDQSRLLAWLKKASNIPSIIYALASFVLPVCFLLLLGLTIAGMITIYFPIVLVLINVLILRKFQARLLSVTESTSGNVRLLASYAALIRMIESRDFDSPRLQQLKEPFLREGSFATRKISSLRRIADFLDGRGNLFYQLLNFVFLLDIHLITAAERWKKNNREDIALWFSNIGEFEALISLAGFKISHPEYVTPKLLSSDSLKVTALGHPLIHPDERVVNDFFMEGTGKVAIVTGSNMSGKSTFLRTVGINAVLAYAGAVTCAKEMNLGMFEVFTGMRTEDNLEEHISSFYAELRRIRKLLDQVKESDKTVLYMLDEVLKGTNTKDRHKGSEALVRRLATSKAMGFVSTHDLELGTLATPDGHIENFSFNSRIEDNEIIFDYTIQKGICHSFNASMLMKKIGILED